MRLCPGGYCCDGTPVWPCTSVSSCGGHRVGRLCGDCAPGYVEAVGSAACAPVHTCDRDQGVVWPVIVLALLASAVLQLTFVSGVWAPAPGFPTGKMKLILYFFQVGGVEVFVPWPRRVCCVCAVCVLCVCCVCAVCVLCVCCVCAVCVLCVCAVTAVCRVGGVPLRYVCCVVSLRCAVCCELALLFFNG